MADLHEELETLLESKGAEILPNPYSLRFRFSAWTKENRIKTQDVIQEISPLNPALSRGSREPAKQPCKGSHGERCRDSQACFSRKNS